MLFVNTEKYGIIEIETDYKCPRGETLTMIIYLIELYADISRDEMDYPRLAEKQNGEMVYVFGQWHKLGSVYRLELSKKMIKERMNKGA